MYICSLGLIYVIGLSPRQSLLHGAENLSDWTTLFHGSRNLDYSGWKSQQHWAILCHIFTPLSYILFIDLLTKITVRLRFTTLLLKSTILIHYFSQFYNLRLLSVIDLTVTNFSVSKVYNSIPLCVKELQTCAPILCPRAVLLTGL